MVNYGEDGDTITLKDNKGELKLSELYKGEILSTGSYTSNKEKIKELENKISQLEMTIDSLNTQLDAKEGTSAFIGTSVFTLPSGTSLGYLTHTNISLNDEYISYSNYSYTVKKSCKLSIVVYARRYKII